MATNKNYPFFSMTPAGVHSPVTTHDRVGKRDKTCPVFVVMLTCLPLLLFSVLPSSAEGAHLDTAELVSPVDAALRYPFTKDASIRCGRWKANSQDYPYFEAPRNRNTRKHAGIDIYPIGGKGTSVKAMKAGQVIKVALFYTRAHGEKTYAVLIDHGDFVANYAELKKPDIKVGQRIGQKVRIGSISGTGQLHLELYETGTTDWLRWYGERPRNLIDPTSVLLGVLSTDRRTTGTDVSDDAVIESLMDDE
jgi:murein DD-endopeptidase MepM/ murein hydrolase activator NlpD